MKSIIKAVLSTAVKATRVPDLLKKTLLMSLPLLAAKQVQAQYNTYFANMDHIYGSIDRITKSDPNLQRREGYVIANTNADPVSPMMYGEVIRTGPAGVQLWTMQYLTPMKSRFTHIEKYNFSGTTNYIVTGSVQNGGGNDDLLVVCIDDNGNVIRSTEIPGTTAPNLVGMKVIPTSDGNFALVALAGSGYTINDMKQTVVIKMDTFLNVLYYQVYESPSNMTDFDSPTDIVEGASPDEYLIVGTSNRNTLLSYSTPCAMATLIDITTGMISWCHNFSTAGTGHWDNAADSWYNAADSSFWLLGNSSIIHYYNITHLDHSGSTLLFRQFYSPSSISYDIYGYELKPSLGTPGNFIVGGWKFNFGSSSAVSPMMAEIEPVSGNVLWATRYTDPSGSSNINRMLAYNENNWLRTTASGQFPYLYHSLMTYRSDGRGYTILGSDTVGNTVEMPRLWRSIDLQGYVVCGKDTPNAALHDSTFYPEPDLQYLGMFPSGGSFVLNGMPTSYMEKTCSGNADGTAKKSLEQTVASTASRIYPNPAADYFMVENGEGLQSISVTDICGRELLHLDADGAQSKQIPVSQLTPGIYMIRITNVHNRTDMQRIQVLH